MSHTLCPRTHLPSSPIFHRPSIPDSWIWKCHDCNRTYPIAVTTRCLKCGHRLCSGRPSSSSRYSSTSTRHGDKFSHHPRRRRRKGNCLTYYDYPGWLSWQRWRCGTAATHDVPPSSEGHGLASLVVRYIDPARARRSRVREVKKLLSEREDQRWERLRAGTACCTEDCDYPGQCLVEYQDALSREYSVVEGDEEGEGDIVETTQADDADDTPTEQDEPDRQDYREIDRWEPGQENEASEWYERAVPI